jgi:hypothetical protein
MSEHVPRLVPGARLSWEAKVKDSKVRRPPAKLQIRMENDQDLYIWLEDKAKALNSTVSDVVRAILKAEMEVNR